MTNVANRDDALRCLQIAKQALRDNDVVKAQRFAAKARRLCDCKEVSAFLSELGSQASSNGNPSDGPSTSTEQSDSACMGAGLRHRNGATPDSSNEATSRPSGPNSAAKKEQEEFVAKILRHRDFYEILGIAKDADDEEIKKAYKKLALKLHPDKNKAPKAEEAFKAVSRAFSCLSDPEKRSNYDRYGHEDRAQAAAAAAAAARGAHGMHNFYAEEIDPMEIFNMFFGVGLHHPHARVFRTHHRTRGFRHQAESANQSINFVSLMHILPILVLFMYTFFSGPSEPLYKLSRDSHFKEEMTTKRFSIPFFVKSSTQFEKDFPVGGYYRAQVELQIESSYHDTLEHLCREERLKQRRIRTWKGTDEAKKMELTHCNKLKETFRTALYVQ